MKPVNLMFDDSRFSKVFQNSIQEGFTYFDLLKIKRRLYWKLRGILSRSVLRALYDKTDRRYHGLVKQHPMTLEGVYSP